MNDDFKKKITAHLEGSPGFKSEEFLAVHEANEEVVSIRLNPFKPAEIFLTEEAIPWCQSGRYLSQRPSFTFDPFFHAGCYYVQEASSMFLEHVLKTNVDFSQPLKVLDLCAAPGGKSTLISSLINEKSLLISNEVIRSRANILADNMARWGTANNIITSNDASYFGKLKNYFDIIIVDAPCSGSGMFRKDLSAINHWSENSVEHCSQRQQRILADVLPALKNSGLLIYSTCSYSKKENEDISDKLLTDFNLESEKITINIDWNIVEAVSENNAFGYRFYPYNLRGEGFYLSCFRKKSSGINESIKSKRKAYQNKKSELFQLDKFIQKPDNFCIITEKEEMYLLPDFLSEELNILVESKFAIINKGIHLGVLKGDDFIPDHHLAMSLLNKNSNLFEPLMTSEDCIEFLKGNDLKKDFQIGWRLITFKNYSLGWYKKLINRANNYYPKQLRIMKQSMNN